MPIVTLGTVHKAALQDFLYDFDAAGEPIPGYFCPR
jgi:putative intracellular protease/amidase